MPPPRRRAEAVERGGRLARVELPPERAHAALLGAQLVESGGLRHERFVQAHNNRMVLQHFRLKCLRKHLHGWHVYHTTRQKVGKKFQRFLKTRKAIIS